MTKDVRLFVYGSLKVGFRHADVLRDAIRVCSASAEPFSLVRYGRYPALVHERRKEGRSHPVRRVHGGVQRDKAGQRAYSATACRASANLHRARR